MSRPLLITDCDEVLLHMVAHFDAWLDEAWCDPSENCFRVRPHVRRLHDCRARAAAASPRSRGHYLPASDYPPALFAEDSARRIVIIRKPKHVSRLVRKYVHSERLKSGTCPGAHRHVVVDDDRAAIGSWIIGYGAGNSFLRESPPMRPDTGSTAARLDFVEQKCRAIDATVIVAAVGNTIGAIVVELTEVDRSIGIRHRLTKPFTRFCFRAKSK